jgi:hypothetical protein
MENILAWVDHTRGKWTTLDSSLLVPNIGINTSFLLWTFTIGMNPPGSWIEGNFGRKKSRIQKEQVESEGGG